MGMASGGLSVRVNYRLAIHYFTADCKIRIDSQCFLYFFNFPPFLYIHAGQDFPQCRKPDTSAVRSFCACFAIHRTNPRVWRVIKFRSFVASRPLIFVQVEVRQFERFRSPEILTRSRFAAFPPVQLVRFGQVGSCFAMLVVVAQSRLESFKASGVCTLSVNRQCLR